MAVFLAAFTFVLVRTLIIGASPFAVESITESSVSFSHGREIFDSIWLQDAFIEVLAKSGVEEGTIFPSADCFPKRFVKEDDSGMLAGVFPSEFL
jgi:hypothetical protein